MILVFTVYSIKWPLIKMAPFTKTAESKYLLRRQPGYDSDHYLSDVVGIQNTTSTNMITLEKTVSILDHV